MDTPGFPRRRRASVKGGAGGGGEGGGRWAHETTEVPCEVKLMLTLQMN